MKTKLIAFVLVIVSHIVNAQDYIPLLAPQTNYITDLALIYQGGTHRPDWNKTQLQPYIYQKKDKGKIEWLFDGFLFIEFKDNLGYEYAKGYENNPAGKKQWKWLLDRNFESGKAILALNSVLDSLAKDNKVPKRKRKVVLTLPEPILHQKNWGGINGRMLDFDIDNDRIIASKWFIDEALKKWQNNSLDQLELTGFYWVAEHSTGASRILPEIARYIKSKGLKFYWIPYWKAAGAADWKSAGFDAAYQQPNHFFNKDIPDSRIDDACAFARKYNMGMEMEFDMRVENPVFERRFYAYLEKFKKNKVLDQSAMAYYEGGMAIYQLATHVKPEMRKLYNHLCEIIIKRQKKADHIRKQ